MPVVDVYNQDREKVGSVELSDKVFDVEVREHLFHEVVRAQLAARRSGTAKTKERNEVRGSQAKAWRQKGTGRARQGPKKGPHWVGGGVAFGPRPRSYAIKVNKKIKRAALCAALSRRQQEGRLVVVSDLTLPEIKTKRVVSLMRTFEAPKALFVDTDNLALSRSARNIQRAHFLPLAELNVYDILRHDHMLISQAAVQALSTRISGEAG